MNSCWPDLILDVRMSGLDAYEVRSAFKSDSHARRATVAMLTPFSHNVYRERAVAAGADEFMTKPFSPIALLKKVEEVLGS